MHYATTQNTACLMSFKHFDLHLSSVLHRSARCESIAYARLMLMLNPGHGNIVLVNCMIIQALLGSHFVTAYALVVDAHFTASPCPL